MPRCLMPRSLLLPLVGVVLLLPSVGYTCGDKFLVPGQGPSLACIHRPPRSLEILIYGNPSSPAIGAVSRDQFASTLELVGHKVVKCESTTDCAAALSHGHFDVVLADPADAAGLKGASGPGVVPVLMKPSKEELGKAKRDYAVAFDASRDAVRLLPLLVKAAKRGH